MGSSTSSKAHTLTKKDQHLLQHAASIVAYAQTDAEFKEQLTLAIRAQDWKATDHIAATHSPYQTPSTLGNAIETAHWLFGTLVEAKDTEQTKAYLATWAADQEIPRSIIIGIIGISIMGPTLGILDEVKKKKKSQLQVVITDSHFATLGKGELAKLTASLGQRVLAHEVKLAGGNVYKLHPDTAEWYLSEPELKLYKVDEATLTELETAAKEEGFTLHGEYKNDQLVALAISPSIDNAFVEDREPTLI